MNPKQRTATALLVGILTGAIMGYWINEGNHSTVQESFARTTVPRRAGMEASYFYTVGLDQHAYIDGKEVDVYYFQEKLELKQDGKLGTDTRRKVLDWNATDIRLMESSKGK